MSSLQLSVVLSSSSEPSTLSNAAALTPGDLGEVGRIRSAALVVEFTLRGFPETHSHFTVRGLKKL